MVGVRFGRDNQMKKETILVAIFIVLVILSGLLFILDDVIQSDTTILQIIVAIVLFGTGIWTYIYIKK